MSAGNCKGCQKPFKRKVKSGYCSACFHGNVDNIKSVYAKERWSTGTAKLLHWQSKGVALTMEDVLHFEAQTACNFCHVPFEDFAGAKNLDHDHATGAYRGALCRCCNTSLGKLGDDLLTVVERVVAYMRHAHNPLAS
jgi:hypothetical protein